MYLGSACLLSLASYLQLPPSLFARGKRANEAHSRDVGRADRLPRSFVAEEKRQIDLRGEVAPRYFALGKGQNVAHLRSRLTNENGQTSFPSASSLRETNHCDLDLCAGRCINERTAAFFRWALLHFYHLPEFCLQQWRILIRFSFLPQGTIPIYLCYVEWRALGQIITQNTSSIFHMHTLMYR